MTATELRIGNYLKFGEMRHACSYHDIANLEKANIKGLDLPLYQPVPLTEDWLKKFGFELVEDLGDMQSYQIPNQRAGYGVRVDHGDLVFYRFMQFGVTDLIYDENYFQYVHQLQNLYYALTGEELTIKEP